MVITHFDSQILDQNQDLKLFTSSKRNLHPILAIHGMWATWQRWENYARFFAKRGHPFFAVTLRYHFSGNKKCKQLGNISVLDYVQDIHKLIERLKEERFISQNPIIFGHSMGGLISLKLAEKGLASALVLINSAPPAGISLRPNLRYQLAIARYLPQLLLSKPFKPNFKIASQFIMNGMPKEDWPNLYEKMVYESGRAAWEIRKEKIQVDFSKIICPTLIIGGENDKIVPPMIAIDMHKKLSPLNPQCELVLFPSAHWIQIENSWTWSAFLILRWLRKKLEK